MKALSFAVALAASSAIPAMAQEAPASPPTAAQVAPEQLSAARLAAGKLFPDGTYARMMSRMDGLMDSMMGQIMQMPMSDLVRMAGLPDTELKSMPKSSMKEMMAIMDPAFERRTSTVMRVMMAEMGRIMTPLEPGMREGLAQSYAKRFSEAELAELNRFFATPTGGAFASESMLLMMDPAVMDKMMEFVPALTREMPAIVQKLASATADLPKPKTFKDLNAGERARLAKVLGIPESQLGKPRPK